MSDNETDISALQAENAALRRRIADLESTTVKFLTLLSTWHDILMVLDKDGRYLEIAPTQSPFLSGVDPAPFLGKTMHDLVQAEAADQYLGVIREALATRQSVTLEYMLPVQGGTMWFHGIVTPLSDTSVLWFARDITDQRRLFEVEAELRLFQLLADNAPDGITLTRQDGRFFYVNPAYRAMTGYGDAIMSKTAYELIADPKQVTEELIASLQKHGLWQGEVTLLKKSGEGLPCQASLMILPSGEKESITAAILRDLTPQRRAEEERIGLSAKVIEAQRDALRELSTPLVPLAEGVIAMPLIGTIDSVRAHQVLEKLLTGITALRARTAILDITGVKVVDSMVADALLKVARAAKLLGARVILTGIGPEVAQSLVHLGADLSGLVTLGTLQSGITYALKER